MQSIAFHSSVVEFFTTWFQFSCPVLIMVCYRFGTLPGREYGEVSRNKLVQSTVGLFFVQKMIIAFTAIINSTKTYVRLKAHICRVSKLLQLYRYIDSYLCVETADARSETDSLYSGALSFDDSFVKWNPVDLIVASNLKLHLPGRGKFVGNTFNFSVKKFHSLGITGPNGSSR